MSKQTTAYLLQTLMLPQCLSPLLHAFLSHCFSHSVTQHLILQAFLLSLLWLHKPFIIRNSTQHHNSSHSSVRNEKVKKRAWRACLQLNGHGCLPLSSLFLRFHVLLFPQPSFNWVSAHLPPSFSLLPCLPPVLQCLIFLCDYTLTSQWTEMTALARSPDSPQLLKAHS